MPRAATAGELALLASGNYNVYTRTWIKNASGTFVNLSSLAGGIDFVGQIELDGDIDEPIAAATIRVKRDIGALSLSPLRTDSTLNRLDDGVTYGALVDVGRATFTETAVVPLGGAPAAGDWKQMFSGITDTVTDDNGADKTLEVGCRGLGAAIADTWTAPTARSYTDLVGGGKPIQDVVQELLDLYVTDAAGARLVTLVTPVDPNYLITSFSWGVEVATDVLSRLIQVIGGDLRYLWNDTTSQWEYTLTIPDRTKTVPDATIGPSQYISVNRLALDRTTVRNEVRVEYGPATQGGIPRAAVVGSDGTSIDRYGKRTVVDSEASDSPIDTADEALRLIGLILSDVKDPKAEQQIEMLYYWPVEIWDLNRWSANGVHYDADQDLAVVHVKHTLGANGGTQHRTVIDVRGTPAGAYLTWFPRFLPTFGATPGSSASNSILRIIPKESTDGTTANVALIVGTLVNHVEAYYRTVPIDEVGDVADFSDTATLPIDGTLFARPDALGALTFAFPQPARGKKLVVRFVPFFFGGESYVEGENVVFPVTAAPRAINVDIIATKVGHLASLTVEVNAGVSDLPGWLTISETVLGVETQLLRVPVTASTTVLDPAAYSELANRAIPAGAEKIEWRAVFEDVSGEDVPFGPVSALPALVDGPVKVDENTTARTATITASLNDAGGYLNPAAADALDPTVHGAVTVHTTLRGVKTVHACTAIPVSGTTGDYAFTLALDPTRPILVEMFRHYVDSSTDLLFSSQLDSNKICDVVNAAAVNNGATANVPVQFDNDGLAGAGNARYSLDGGATYITDTMASDYSALFSGITRTPSTQSMIIQGKNAIDGLWGNPTTIQIDALDTGVGSVQVLRNTPDASHDRFVWSATRGTMQVSIDGGAYTTPSASPWDVANTSAHTYDWKLTGGDGSTQPWHFDVGPSPNANGALVGLYGTLSNALHAAGSPGTVDFAWNPSGFASGVEFQIYVRDDLRYGDEVYHPFTTTSAGAGTLTYTCGGTISTNHADPSFVIGFYVVAIIGSTLGPQSMTSETTYNHP